MCVEDRETLTSRCTLPPRRIGRWSRRCGCPGARPAPRVAPGSLPATGRGCHPAARTRWPRRSAQPSFLRLLFFSRASSHLRTEGILWLSAAMTCSQPLDSLFQCVFAEPQRAGVTSGAAPVCNKHPIKASLRLAVPLKLLLS